MDDRLSSVADSLLRDGAVDNAPDAYLAAIRILAAADRLADLRRVPASSGRPRHVA